MHLLWLTHWCTHVRISRLLNHHLLLLHAHWRSPLLIRLDAVITHNSLPNVLGHHSISTHRLNRLWLTHHRLLHLHWLRLIVRVVWLHLHLKGLVSTHRRRNRSLDHILESHSCNELTSNVCRHLIHQIEFEIYHTSALSLVHDLDGLLLNLTSQDLV